MMPNTQQAGGIVGGATFSLWNTITSISLFTTPSPELEIVKSAIIGATVGFIVTTLLRLLWDFAKAKIKKRFDK